jgi:hypothetical protein
MTPQLPHHHRQLPAAGVWVLCTMHYILFTVRYVVPCASIMPHVIFIWFRISISICYLASVSASASGSGCAFFCLLFLFLFLPFSSSSGFWLLAFGFWLLV